MWHLNTLVSKNMQKKKIFYCLFCFYADVSCRQLYQSLTVCILASSFWRWLINLYKICVYTLKPFSWDVENLNVCITFGMLRLFTFVDKHQDQKENRLLVIMMNVFLYLPTCNYWKVCNGVGICNNYYF
jgi:hypothetical protein